MQTRTMKADVVDRAKAEGTATTAGEGMTVAGTGMMTGGAAARADAMIIQTRATRREKGGEDGGRRGSGSANANASAREGGMATVIASADPKGAAERMALRSEGKTTALRIVEGVLETATATGRATADAGSGAEVGARNDETVGWTMIATETAAPPGGSTDYCTPTHVRVAASLVSPCKLLVEREP